MQSTLHDPQIVQSYYNEYLRLLNYYMNLKRPSTFIRYFNIDISQSTYNEKLESTYDLYHVSNLKFNIYDFTPSYYIAPVVNNSANVDDLRGQMMDATTSVVIYTIESPRIHDLVTFYSPVNSGEIFRVSNLRTPVNAIHSDPSVKWFELELEYAPITQTRELKLLNHFVYDLTEEKYITYSQYVEFEAKITDCKSIFAELHKYYDPYHDLYQVNNIVPIEVNEVIIFFKKLYGHKYRRLFDEYNFPYGYLDCMNFTQYYSNVDVLPYHIGNYNFHIYNFTTKIIEPYLWSVNNQNCENDIDKLFMLSYQLLQKAFNWTTNIILNDEG
ncbi:MAG: hypothetical protein PHD05_01250 [Sphaerochaetaceae bacterium]|nr:hypothetical protein [Sphaerochaetaceae bacterium]